MDRIDNEEWEAEMRSLNRFLSLDYQGCVDEHFLRVARAWHVRNGEKKFIKEEKKFIKNQYGDSILSLHKKFFEVMTIYGVITYVVEERLNCFSSRHVGMGTCNCCTHNPYKTRRYYYYDGEVCGLDVLDDEDGYFASWIKEL